MVPLSEVDIDEILERDAPGFSRVHDKQAALAADAISRVDAQTPETVITRHAKVITDGGAPREEDISAEGSLGELVETPLRDDEAEDVIVAIRPKDLSDPSEAAANTKAVVISAKDRKIVGFQG